MTGDTAPLSELEDLRTRLGEAEETLRAIRGGEVDALVVAGTQGDQIFTLKGADHSYRVFLEQMHQGAATLTADHVILYCNRRFAELLAMPLEEVVGGALDRFIRETDRPALEAILREGAEEAGGKGEVSFVCRGEPVPVYLAVSALPWDENVEALCLVVTDLTEQKRNEQLVADERLARSILEHASEAIVVCDAEHRVLRASLAARRLCSSNPVGESFWRAFPLHGTGPDGHPPIPLDAICQGQIAQGIEAELPRGRGKTRQFQVSAGPLLSPDASILGCVITLTDITERRRAEMEVERARLEAEAANQAKDRFLATLSHELRTPLTPVLAVVSVLQEDERLPGDVRVNLGMMRRNIELEARLIDDMLDLTRITRGKLPLHREISDLRQVLDDSLQTVMKDFVDKRLRLTMDLADADHRVWADTPRLTQVFWNLFSNAVKFTPEDGAITVRSRREEAAKGSQLVVEITDTGIGIEPDVLETIFDAFQQGEKTITRRFGGLGLGLAISKAIIELHGGALAAESFGKDHGSTFSVRLPAGDLPAAAPAPKEAPSSAEAPEGGAAQNGAFHILLVEDHSDTAEAMADLLRAMGHEITVAGSVAAGLAAAERLAGRLDLVVSDLGLPDGSGLDLMQQLTCRYHVRGIALSGYGMEEDVRRSLDAGFERHLTKPINLQALHAAIQETLRSEL